MPKCASTVGATSTLCGVPAMRPRATSRPTTRSGIVVAGPFIRPWFLW